MADKKTIAATVIAAGALAVGGASIANAVGNRNATPVTGASTGYAQGAMPGYGMPGQMGEGRMGGHDMGGRGMHTPVTGTEATSVTNAIKAKDSTVRVSQVSKEQDGSYDAFGTKAGQPVHIEVSKDLKTVTIQTGMGGRGMGGHGMGGTHTAVTGTEATSVTNAVKAKDSSLTVQRVMKDADGSYDVMATKAGQPVHVDVTKDLKTVTIQTGMGGMHGPMGDGGAAQQPSGSATAAPSGYSA